MAEDRNDESVRNKRMDLRRDDDRDVRDMVIEQSVLLREIGRRLLNIEQKVDRMPCEENKAKLKFQERVIMGLLGFSGSLLIGLLANIDKIRKAFS